MRTNAALNRRLAGALTISALALGSTLAAGALSPAAAVSPIPTGSLSGTVVGTGGVALPGASVYVYGDTNNDNNYVEVDRYQATGATGDFLIDHLPTGNYKIEFYSAGYEGEYYADAVSQLMATPLVVGAGPTLVPTVSLAARAPWPAADADTEVTGFVTDAATGKPIDGASVTAYDSEGNEVDWSSTDAAGRYLLEDLQGSASVKLEFNSGSNGARIGYRTAWSGGARTMAAASTVAITPGTTVMASSALTQDAGIRGKVLTAAGAAPYGGYVNVLDADSNYVSDAEIRPDGTYYASGLNPGEEYRVVVTSAYDYLGNDFDGDRTYYFDSWYADGNSFASATPLTAGTPGVWTSGINLTLRNTLVALEQPSITGEFVVGKTLTGNKGRWNRNGNSTFGYEWLRGAAVVGTASTYTLTGADAGQSIALRVTNTNFDNGQTRSLSATTSASVAKYSSAVSAKAKKLKKGKKAGSVQVTVSVKAGAQSAASTTGTVKVTEGKKKVATLKLKNGKATFLVKKAGKHSYKLAYSGNGTTLSDEGKVIVKGKKSKKK